MADILRRVAALAINRASTGNIRNLFPLQVRTVFSSSGIGIDGFKLSREQHASRYAPSMDGFKKRFVDSIGQSDSQILTEDLRNMIMSANSDQEIDTVIQALKKYSGGKQKFTDYHFGSPVMRLLYIHNKTDLAMQLFMDESLKNIFNDSASSLVLMNKLIEDKRFDDAVKVFEFGSKRGFSTSSGRAYPSDVTMLAIEALYQQNTKESFSKAKELISKVRERDSDINPRTAAMTALLAIQQGEPAFAMEVIGAIRAQNLTNVQNIRAICYADMGRVEEAINVIQLLADQTPASSDRRRVFPLTMRHIRMAAEKTKDQNLLTRFEELSKSVMKNNRLSTVDLPEFIGQPINRRKQAVSNQMRPGGNAQRMGGNQRNVGYRRDFNQQSNNFRQGMTGGFNRSNRFDGFGYNNQSGRFGNNKFQRLDSMGSDRRSQNAYVGGYQRNADNEQFSPRNRSSSYNQSSRFNRNESGSSSPFQRSRERDSNDVNLSGRRMGSRSPAMTMGDQEPGETAWTSADNADTMRFERREKTQQAKGTRSSNVTDEKKTRREKSSEGTSGSNEDADPWGRSSSSSAQPASSPASS